jgi:hypothetical protein
MEYLIFIKAAKIIECFVFLQVTRPKDENFFNINYYQKRPKSSCDYTLNEEEYIMSKDDSTAMPMQCTCM